MEFLFSFDPQKSALNQKQHGIDFEKAQALWQSHFIEVRAKVVNNEMRYANIGKIGNVWWTAIVTYRGSTRRIVSVYESSADQKARYEQSRKPTL